MVEFRKESVVHCDDSLAQQEEEQKNRDKNEIVSVGPEELEVCAEADVYFFLREPFHTLRLLLIFILLSHH